jgi:catechol 2,3-dioxygenase-like lactoylglutathione lyase family enzyme
MPIAVAIDHVILAVHDLAAAAHTFAATLGLHVSGGGVHPRFGTANRIIVLEDDYIELLAAQPGEEARGWIAAYLATGHEGCAGLALATADPEGAAATLRARGVAVDGPAPGRLEAESGFSRGWRSVRIVGHDASALPFLIRHESTGEERRRRLAGPVGLAPHPLGIRHVASVTIAVEDLEASITRYGVCFDLEPEARGDDPMLSAHTASLRLPSGALILLAAPLEPTHGPLARALTSHGEGPFAVNLAVDNLAEAVRELRGRGLGVRVDEPDGVLVAAQINHRQLHGARLGLVQAS